MFAKVKIVTAHLEHLLSPGSHGTAHLVLGNELGWPGQHRLAKQGDCLALQYPLQEMPVSCKLILSKKERKQH